MSLQVNAGTITFIAGEALPIFRLVKLVSGKVHLVDAADAGLAIGVTQSIATGDGVKVAVRLLKDPGTFTMTAKGAFSAGATVKVMNDGLVDDTGSGDSVGYALEEATAENDQVEILPLQP